MNINYYSLLSNFTWINYGDLMKKCVLFWDINNIYCWVNGVASTIEAFFFLNVPLLLFRVGVTVMCLSISTQFTPVTFSCWMAQQCQTLRSGWRQRLPCGVQLHGNALQTCHLHALSLAVSMRSRAFGFIPFLHDWREVIHLVAIFS